MANRSPQVLLAALLLAVAGGARAAGDPPVIRLPPEEIARIQAAAEARPLAGATVPEREPRRIHGEVGASIGTGGSRDVFGAINVPLGEDGQALLSGGAGREQLQRRVRRNLDRR